VLVRWRIVVVLGRRPARRSHADPERHAEPYPHADSYRHGDRDRHGYDDRHGDRYRHSDLHGHARDVTTQRVRKAGDGGRP
jgi:hypothetical protein